MKKVDSAALVIVLVHLALLSATEAMARTYTTNFPLTENPISEGGNWINGKTTGLDWTDISTTPGLAIGLESGTRGYDDATALLTGTWGSNQTVTATVSTTNQLSSPVYEEVEIRLRSSLSAHNCTGYEVLFSLSGSYVQIVRWNGALGDFTYVATTSGSQYNLHAGDTVTGTISNNTITAYINGTQVLQGTDGTYSSGNPGMGIFLQGTTGVNGDYGFTSFTATDGVNAPGLKIAGPDSNGTFTLQCSGIPGATYGIQHTDYLNPPNWQLLSSGTANQLGLFQVTDTPPNDTPQRFYRLVWPYQAPPPPTLSIVGPDSNGTLTLQCNGSPGMTYRIQYTDNLNPSNWQPFSTGTANVSGLFQVTNIPMNGVPQRFYRSVWP